MADLFPKTIPARPFIKWAGGKSQLLPQFDSLLPEGLSEIGNLVYIEPFVGGGAMLLHMLQRYPNISRAVVNDINADLVTVYKTLKRAPHKLSALLLRMQREYLALGADAKKDYYLAVRDGFNEHPAVKARYDLNRAASFIFLNKTCYNGLYRVNKKGEFNVPWGKQLSPSIVNEEEIMAVWRVLRRVTFIQGDFETTLNYVAAGRTFVYFDPPYRPLSETSSFTAYDASDFGDAEQRRLSVFVGRMADAGCMVMASNSDGRSCNPDDTFIEDLYARADFNIRRVRAKRNINSKGDGRGEIPELVIRNYQ